MESQTVAGRLAGINKKSAGVSAALSDLPKIGLTSKKCEACCRHLPC